MNYEDIIRRFDDIQELPVSEEVLGAYFEGSFDIEDRQQIQDYINSDLFLINQEFEINEYHDAHLNNINTTEPVNIDDIELPTWFLVNFPQTKNYLTIMTILLKMKSHMIYQTWMLALKKTKLLMILNIIIKMIQYEFC